MHNFFNKVHPSFPDEVRDVDAASLGHRETRGVSLTVPETTTLCQLAGTTLLMKWYANRQNWSHSQNSYREGVHHYLVISLDLTQLSLYIKPCGCRRTFPQEGIWAPAGRDCQVVPVKHGPLRFRMILECYHTLTGMLPFVVAMEEGCYGLWRLHIDDDDDDDVVLCQFIPNNSNITIMLDSRS